MINKLFISIVIIYKKCISPFLPPACIYYPTCSTYAIEALKKYGPLKGIFLAVKRIFKCNPFSKGGFDPVP